MMEFMNSCKNYSVHRAFYSVHRAFYSVLRESESGNIVGTAIFKGAKRP